MKHLSLAWGCNQCNRQSFSPHFDAVIEPLHAPVYQAGRAGLIDVSVQTVGCFSVYLLKAAVAHCADIGVRVERLLTDNDAAERTAWLPPFMSEYNARRPHSALAYKSPACRLGGNNLRQLDT